MPFPRLLLWVYGTLRLWTSHLNKVAKQFLLLVGLMAGSPSGALSILSRDSMPHNLKQYLASHGGQPSSSACRSAIEQ
jgi:hypothetical protein